MSVDLVVAACAAVAVVSWVWGAAYMGRVVKKNAEHAVMEDHRVSMLRKCAIVARIRGCPVEWVIEEKDALRLNEGANR